MEQIPDWETLIASRMRPCATICTIEDPAKRARKMKERRRAKSHQRIAYRKKYREENRDEINAKKRDYNATEEGKRKNSEYNAMWREKNAEYDKQRKREWWRRTHPNPKPIGRPRKNAKLGIADCRTQQTVRHHVPD